MNYLLKPELCYAKFILIIDILNIKNGICLQLKLIANYFTKTLIYNMYLKKNRYNFSNWLFILIL